MQLHQIKTQRNLYSIYMLYLSNNTHIQIPENLFQAAITAKTWGLFFVNKQNGGFAQLWLCNEAKF